MTAATRHLFTFLTGDDADLNLACRRIAYDRLVLLTTADDQGRAEDIVARERAIAGPDAAHIVALPRHDMHEAVDRLRTLVSDLPPQDKATLNLAGADPAHVSAAMIVAFDHGMPTVICQHGQVVALPILYGVRIAARFEPDERRLLKRLDRAGEAVEHLAQHLLIPKTRIHKAGRALRDKGLVTLRVEDGATSLTLTEQGERLRPHVV